MRYLSFLLLSLLLLGCQAITAEAVSSTAVSAVFPATSSLLTDSTQGALQVGGNRVYAYDAARGSEITFLAEPDAHLDIALEIYTRDLELLAEADAFFEGSTETLTYTFSKEGRYLISVYAFSDSAGDFHLSAIKNESN